MGTGPPRPAWPLRWQVWQLPRRPLTWLVVVELAVLALAVGDITAALAAPAALIVAGGHPAVVIAVVLAVTGAVHAELDVAALRRDRAQFNRISTFDFLAVWTFGAALLLPPVLFVPTILFVHYHMWWRVVKARTPLYRSTFTVATVVAAAYAAHTVVEALGTGDPTAMIRVGPGGPPWVAAALGVVPVAVPALLAYAAVNQVLVMVMIALATPDVTRAALLGSAEDNAVEIATLLVGVATAAMVVHSPALLVVLPGPLLVVQRLAVLRRLRHAATIDAKTGLLTYAAWHDQARQLLACVAARRLPAARPRGLRSAADRRSAPIGVLMCDLDHFKTINDTHGHQAGDTVLRHVATVLRAGVREHDLVCRFGGEEFAVLLRGPRRPAAPIDPGWSVTATAERIRTLVAAAQITIDTPDGPLTIGRVTISVGAVVLTADSRPEQLDTATDRADRALYAAKRAGRDRVTVWRHSDDGAAAGAVPRGSDTVPQAWIDLDSAPTVPLPIVAESTIWQESIGQESGTPPA